MNAEIIVYVLIVYLVVMHGVFLYALNVMTNKVMSRNYFEYVRSREHKEVKKETKIIPDDMSDVRQLDGINL